MKVIKNCLRNSKISLKGIHKTHTEYDISTLRGNEVLMDTPIYVGSSVLELSKLLMYGT